jgi:DNA uptake protein ComE-like DNA-binding protein
MIREFFYLQKSDRKVILTLLLVIVIALGVFFIMGGENEEEISQQDSMTRTAYYDVASRKVERFAFDPNTADSTQLLRLGLQSWQVRNIYKYRAAGGVYRKKEDFARLYGLTVKQYRELEPYIRISDDYLPASSLLKHERRGYRDGADTVRQHHASIPSEHHYQSKISAGETVVLNTADTTLLKTVPGIGPYFARKIVQYGERLGGYVSVDQLDEIEDFPLDAKNFLVVADPAPRKLNVNKLSLNELKRHPYINFYQARAITDYRRLHGPIHSLLDLRLSKDFPPEAIARLEPYVEY